MQRRDLGLAGLVFAALSLLYAWFRCPSFGGADSPQHVLSAVTWGVSWPPGYPLYVMLGHLASRLPGSPAGNVSLLSGFLHALAAAVFFLTLRRLDIRPLSALAAAALMALSPLYWFYSELGEVRALNDLLAVASAYAVVAWSQGRRPGALFGLAACLGLGISHHPTFVLLLPAFAWWLWRNAALPRGRSLVWFGAGVFLFIALPYLILGIRLNLGTPAYNLTSASGLADMPALFLRRDLGGLWRVVAGQGLFGAGGFDWARLWQHGGWFLRSAQACLLPLGLPLAALGIVASWRRRPRELVFWGLWLGGPALCYIVLGSQQLRLMNPEFAYAIAARFHLLPLLAAFAAAGLGAHWLEERFGRIAGGLVLAAALVLPFLRQPIDLRRSGYVLDYAREMVRATGPSDMIVTTSDAAAFAFLYLDLVEHAAGDRVLLVPSLFGYPPYQRWLERRHPGLTSPSGMSHEWDQWRRLNPSRALYAEAEAWYDLRGAFPASAPSGVLIRAWDSPPDPEALRAGIERLLGWRAVFHRDLQPFSPELELVNTYRLMLNWGLESLTRPEDAALAERLRARLQES
jgi:hypothetical protein